MQYKETESNTILILEKGELVSETITKFCQDQQLVNAYFRGIGAVNWLSCGYYALEEKKYYFTEYTDLLEVTSLTGNITLKDETPFVHMHGVFTDKTNNAFGGHIKEMRVGVTLEVILTPLRTRLERKLDNDIGLYLINCGDG